MANIENLKFNELKAEAKKLGIIIKNGKKEDYLKAVLDVLKSKKSTNSKPKAEVKKDLKALSEVTTGVFFTYPTGSKVCEIREVVDATTVIVGAKDSTRQWKELATQKVAVCQ